VLSLGNLRLKWEAFGWEVIEMQGNEIQNIIDTLKIAKKKCFKQKPVLILMHTEMGFGVDFMEGTNEWHGKAPNDEQLENALSQLKSSLKDY
jgi:transketolase